MSWFCRLGFASKTCKIETSEEKDWVVDHALLRHFATLLEVQTVRMMPQCPQNKTTKTQSKLDQNMKFQHSFTIKTNNREGKDGDNLWEMYFLMR